MEHIHFSPVETYSFDDVLIKPRLTTVESRKMVHLKTNLTKEITINIPLIAANMDTICEDRMAISMALAGGIGIIHRFCSVSAQVEMVERVKRFVNCRISNPYSVFKDTLILEVKKIMDDKKVSNVLVISNDNILLGIITRRDMEYYELSKEHSFTIAEEIMTHTSNLTVGKYYQTNEELETILLTQRLEKLPLVDDNFKVIGLITMKDISYYKKFKDISTLDELRRLRCGAAIGVNGDYLERAKALIVAGVDVIVIDIAHGHSITCANVIKHLKEIAPSLQIIAGNVATAEGTEFLINAGADAIKVNIGAGSICKTRETTGCGVPQLSAVLDCVRIAKTRGIPIISDGGNCGKIGNIFKALAGGASSVMLGNFIAGTDETPGAILIKNGKKVKMIRGMAGYMSNASKFEKLGSSSSSTTNSIEDMCPEGVEGYIAYKGDVFSILKQITKGISSGMSYVGCHTMPELKKTPIEFIKITSNGNRESGIHNINEI